MGTYIHQKQKNLQNLHKIMDNMAQKVIIKLLKKAMPMYIWHTSNKF